jgi:PAS domain S-box-containing protein
MISPNHILTQKNKFTQKEMDMDAWWRMLLDQIPAMIWVTNTQKEVRYVNKKLADFTGMPISSHLGHNWIEIIHPEDREAVLKRFTEAFDARERYEIQCRVRHHGGEQCWVIYSGEPAYVEDVFVGYIGTCTDISKRVDALNRLASSNRLHRMVADNYPGMISLIDQGYRYILVHGQAIEQMNLNETAFEGQVIGFRGDSDFTTKIRAVIDKAFLGESLVGEIETNGQIHAYRSIPIHNPEGDIIAVLTHTWDITPERKMQSERDAALDRVKEALRIRSDFMSVAAHELRTPLTSALGYIQVIYDRLEKRNGLHDDERKYFQVVMQQTEKLSLMVSSLLDITRIERGVLSVDRRIMNISDVLSHIVEEMATTTNIHTFPTHIKGGIFVSADMLRMEQVFRNVLSNAIKYSPKGGDITTTMIIEDGSVVITVKDQGIGVPKADLNRVVHERFYRAPNVGSVQTGITGFGIGLVVANEILEMHGGEIQIKSEGEGKGALVIIRIPLLTT